MKLKTIIPAVLGVIFVGFAMSTVGINDAGYRTVIQYPNGTLKFQFDSGWYFDWGGKTTEYKDVITFDFDRQLAEEWETGTVESQGIQVTYQDGGKGTVYGKVQFRLPDDEPTMSIVHKTYRSGAGLASKLLKSVTEESASLSAGLMTSEEAYAERRADYGELTRSQIAKGKYRTKLETRTVEVATGRSDPNGIPIMDKQETKVPVIRYDNSGQEMRERSAISELGISLAAFQIVAWDFEEKTLSQIDRKREANMAIITAKANANKAEFEKLEVIAEGQKNVEEARYKEEQEKIKQIVIADREAEKQVIAATALVNVNEQNALAAAEDLKAAKLEKQAMIARGEGEAEAKRLVMEADGALQRKLDAYIEVNAKYAQAIAAVDTWVPQVQMGSKEGNGSAAVDLMELLSVKAAKDLSLDMAVKK